MDVEKTQSANKRYLILDVESTIYEKGNPFSELNSLCYIGWKTAGTDGTTIVKAPFDLSQLQDVVDSHDFLVAFNAKFDCHWLERSGVVLSRIRIWDCQYAAFLYSNQRQKYPSLNGECAKLGLGEKIDVIAEKYWSKNINTPDIPEEEMREYLAQDIALTEKLFLYQQEMFRDKQRSKWRLFQLHMEDQVCLREMERNGILYDVETSLTRAQHAEKQIESIEAQLRAGYEGVPINFDSTDHLSAYLYGGTIVAESRLPVGVFKTGAKIGQPRYKIVKHEFKLPRLFEPLERSELKKEGLWSTDEATLKQLRGTKQAKERLRLLDERAKLEKLRGTYYTGFPKTIAQMVWPDNTIHSNLNQCVASTGRLSSTKPNQQNIPPEVKQLCISRYD